MSRFCPVAITLNKRASAWVRNPAVAHRWNNPGTPPEWKAGRNAASLFDPGQDEAGHRSGTVDSRLRIPGGGSGINNGAGTGV